MCHGGHLGNQIRLPLAIQNLMLFGEFQDCHHGHYLGYGTERFSNSESPRHPDASHQISVQSNLRFSRRGGLKILEQKDLAILNFHNTPMPPIKCKLNQTFYSRGRCDLKTFKMAAAQTGSHLGWPNKTI